MSTKEASASSAPAKKSFGEEQDRVRGRPAVSNVSCRLCPGLHQGTAIREGTARGKAGEQYLRNKGSGQPCLASGNAEGLRTRGGHQYSLLQPYTRARKSNLRRA